MAETIQTDVLIIGGGIGGAFAAVYAKEAGAKKIALVSKGDLGTDSASTFGAGVYYAVSPDDDMDEIYSRRTVAEKYGAPTLYAGGGLYDEEWIDIAFVEAYERFVEMDEWGVKVDKDPDGKYKRMTTRGNEPVYKLPGPDTMAAMAKKVRSLDIQIIGNTIITDLLTEGAEAGGRVIGAVGFDIRTAEFRVFESKAVILATGGCGFKSRWSGHRNICGDGAAWAYEAGAILGGFESGNLIVPGAALDIMGQNPLVGFGAHWITTEGERYMLEYDPVCDDKAPTARLSEATALEIRGGRGPIYLDITHFTPEQIRDFQVLYPLTVAMLERARIIVNGKAIAKIEVEPVFVGTFNSTGGGLVINTRCETSLPGLYAIGDAMMRYLHNPVAISGACITGARAGKFAALYAKDSSKVKIDKEQVEATKRIAFSMLDREDGIDAEHVLIKIQEEILPYDVSIIAKENRLDKALKEIERIKNEDIPNMYALDPHYLRGAHEVKNICLNAEMYLRSRLLRKESRETCLREDYPYVDNENWLKWTRLKKENGQMKLWTEDLPIEKYKYKPERKKFLHPAFETATRRGVKWG